MREVWNDHNSNQINDMADYITINSETLDRLVRDHIHKEYGLEVEEIECAQAYEVTAKIRPVSHSDDIQPLPLVENLNHNWVTAIEVNDFTRPNDD